MKRILCSMFVFAVLVFATEARADDPAPSVTVMVYYDGSAALSDFHDNVLMGFAENPAYLPVVETADPEEFSAAIASGGFQVFVGISMDSVAADQWESEIEAAEITGTLVVLVPDQSGEYQWALKIVDYHERAPVAIPVPGPEQAPWPEQSPPAEVESGEGEKTIIRRHQPFWDFLDQLERLFRERLAEMLRKIGEILEQLQGTVHVEVSGELNTLAFKGKKSSRTMGRCRT